VRGQRDLGFLHREDHRLGAAQVGDVRQQGEHHDVERARGQPVERHRVDARLRRDEHAQHLTEVLARQVGRAHAHCRGAIRDRHELPHPEQHLVADLPESGSDVGKVDVIERAERARP